MTPERPKEEILVKDPEVERRVEGFQGKVAVNCHYNPRAFPNLNQTSPSVVLSKVCLGYLLSYPLCVLGPEPREGGSRIGS